MEKLIQGIHNFRANIFGPKIDFFRTLADGQYPQALFITCSDSRVVPDLITQADPGDLFVMRNVGNIVPPYSGASAAEAAGIEYAVRGLKVKDIIVCGHTRCGAMDGLLNPGALDDMPRVRDWLRHADSCREIVRSLYGHLTGEARWKVTVEENVLTQLEHLRTHPAVAVGLANGDVKLHGWVYKMETGQVFTYDPTAGQFVPLDHSNAEPPTRHRSVPTNGSLHSTRTMAPAGTDSP
jgi:carbonic anhydrase